MTEYWKSQEKAFCDICKCWLTDNKSSIDFHKNGKRHKENVEKRLRDIQRKSKANEKRDKKFDHEMQRIEQAAAEACKRDGELSADISTQLKSTRHVIAQGSDKNSGDSDSEKTSDIYNIGQPKILHRKETKTSNETLPSSSTSQSSSSFGSWKTVTAPAYEDLELPQVNYGKQIYEPKLPEKRKMEFVEKTVTSTGAVAPASVTSSWIKVETPSVAFKKRKSSKSNMRQRGSDD